MTPKNDNYQHKLDIDCPCEPKLEKDGDNWLVFHRLMDRGEVKEKVDPFQFYWGDED